MKTKERREKMRKKERERKIPLPLSLFFSLSLAVCVVVFAPLALSLDGMMIFSGHSERTYASRRSERERERKKKKIQPSYSLPLVCALFFQFNQSIHFFDLIGPNRHT